MKRATTIVFLAVFLGCSIIASAQPGKPTLTLPSKGATKVSVSDNIVWNSPTAVDSFQVQISLNTTFANPVLDRMQDATNVYTFANGLLKKYTVYHWRVRGKDSNGYGEWSDTFNFRTIDSAAPAPTLFLPTKGFKNAPVFPDLIWRDVARASRYQLQLSTSPGFSPANLDTIIGSSKTIIEYTKDTLKPGVIYYWHVRAENEAGWGDWSQTFDFEVTFLPPTKPVLLAPVNGATNQYLTPMLDWTTSNQTAKYRLYICRDRAMTQVVYKDSSIKKSEFWYHGNDTFRLKPDTIYYWAVAAGNDDDFYSRYSDTFEFTTANMLPPKRPLNVSPKTASIQHTRMPVFTWNDTTSINPADSFYLHVSTFNGFTDTTLLVRTTAKTYSTTSPLDYLTVFYWRVAGKNDGGFSPWSYFWNLTTQITRPDKDEFAATVYPNPAGNMTNFAFELKQAQQVRIAITDITGREVLLVHNGTLTADKHTIGIDLSTLPTGNYFVAIAGEKGMQALPFVKN